MNNNVQSSGTSHPKQNCSFCGQSETPHALECTDSTSSELLQSVVAGENLSLLDHSTHCSNDFEKKDTLIQSKVMLLVEELNVSITTSPNQEKQSLEALASSTVNYNNGNLSENSDVLEQALKQSPMLKWVFYPFVQLLDKDDQSKFCDWLIKRTEMEKKYMYPRRYMHFYDAMAFLVFLAEYVVDRFALLLPG